MEGIAITPPFVWYNTARNEVSFSWDGETLSFKDEDLFEDFSQLGYDSLVTRSVYTLPLRMDSSTHSQADKDSIAKFAKAFFDDHYLKPTSTHRLKTT